MPTDRLYARHDAAGQARYQEVRQLARGQARVLAGTPGTLKQRTQSGRKYWVREHIRADGSKVDEYLGTEAALDRARLAALRSEIELAKALASGSSKLRLFGYQRIDRKPAAVLEVFFNRGLTGAGLTLVGSHAYGVLLNELGVIAPGYRTRDLDVAPAAALAVALPKGAGFEQLLQETGLDFVPVPDMPSLRALARIAPLLDYFARDPLEAVALSPNQVVPVKVPAPERFVLHKLYSSQSRRTERDKVRKDLEQAALLAAVVEEDTPGGLRDAFRRMPAEGRPAVRRGAAAASRLLHEEAYAFGLQALKAIAGGA